MITVKARYNGHVLIPVEPLDLPVGPLVDLQITHTPPENGEKPPLLKLWEELQQFPDNPDWPPDGAAQMDHYLYGMPKKS
jgi:hypothetical protein